MKFQILTLAAALSMSHAVLLAESSAVEVSAPELGFVYDPATQTIRKLSGIPGAATLDGTVATGVSFTQAWVHSASQSAVGVAKTGQLAVSRWDGETASAFLESALSGIKRASFSRSGDYVVISDGNLAEVWTSLGAAPALAGTLDPQGGITSVAVNDRGEAAVGTGSGQLLVYSGGDTVLAASSSGLRRGRARRTGNVSTTGGEWTAIAFLPGGDDLVAADGGQVVVVSNAASSASRQPLATLGSDVSALGISLDGATIVAATGENLTILQDGSSAEAAANFAVNGLASLNGNAVFHLVSGVAGAVTILDADATPARVMEVPGHTVLASFEYSGLELDGGLAQ